MGTDSDRDRDTGTDTTIDSKLIVRKKNPNPEDRKSRGLFQTLPVPEKSPVPAVASRRSSAEGFHKVLAAERVPGEVSPGVRGGGLLLTLPLALPSIRAGGLADDVPR